MARIWYTLRFLIFSVLIMLLLMVLWTHSPENNINDQNFKQKKDLEFFEAYSFLMTPKAQPGRCITIPQRQISLNEDPLLDSSLPYVTITAFGNLGYQTSHYMTLLMLRDIFGIRVAIGYKTHRVLSKVYQHLQIPMINTTYHTPGAEETEFRELFTELSKNLENVSPSSLNILRKSYAIRHKYTPRDIMWLYRDKLRKELILKSSIINKAKEKIENTLRPLRISRENITLITVHVRRTDYKSKLERLVGMDLLGTQYFKRAFKFYRERFETPFFLVASDDPDWCQKHLQGHDVKITSSPDAAVDFALLTLGDHHIQSFGSFGFTSALLGYGAITYPVSYSKKKTMQQTNIFRCVKGPNTLLPINAGK